MDKTDTVFIGGIIGVLGMLLLAQTVGAGTPQGSYQCPVCGEYFTSYDALYGHFMTAHPAEPIDIVWED